MCKCIAKVDRDLAKYNTVLVTTLFSQQALLRTEKLDAKKRGKASTILASFCPFCGIPYRKSSTPTSAES